MPLQTGKVGEAVGIAAVGEAQLAVLVTAILSIEILSLFPEPVTVQA